MSNVNKSFNPVLTRDIRYLNRDFNSLKNALIAYSKNYFPNTYKDFTPAAPGMMFMEQAAYVGDVLSFYTDYIFKENILASAQERKNIIQLASYLGYKVQATKAAVGTLDIYQLCPAISDSNGNYTPDPMYMLYIQENSQFSNNSLYYILTQDLDFSINTQNSPRTDTVYSRNQDGTPQFFLLQKTGNISSGQIYTKQVVVNSPVPNYSIQLDENNVLQVLSIVDSNNNEWYEADYMAQELIPIELNNTATTTQFSDYRDSTPRILNYISTSRKFIVSVDEKSITTITFGSGTSQVSDELVNLDSNLIGNGLSKFSDINNPVNTYTFLNNQNYGAAPYNTTLTIQYLVGGGIDSNCQVGDITNIAGINYQIQYENLTPAQTSLLNTVQNSLKVYNSVPCVGGADSDSNDEIRMNAIASFSSQNRAVTPGDYLTRIYSLPAQFGYISKAYVTSNSNINTPINIQQGIVSGSNNMFLQTPLNRQFVTTNTNPFAINVYVLSYDSNKNLITLNPATLFNLMTYLKQFKILTDEVNIIDGYIINIGVDISISLYGGYNKQEVLSDCLAAAQSFFNIDNWSFSQPINIGQLQLQIANVQGVQSIPNITITNKTSLDGLYSKVSYDIEGATRNNIVYPSVDASIFEVKYPNTDITISIV